MPSLDRQQLVSALILVAMALFVGRNLVREPYRAWMARALIAAFLLALGIALVLVAEWLLG
ncbi:MAG TPA: hypothetical protein VJ487_18345 [Alphaproteobacteria bacterium]|nr:hypothetical protein [Alphaproteobacteria bacterium]